MSFYTPPPPLRPAFIFSVPLMRRRGYFDELNRGNIRTDKHTESRRTDLVKFSDHNTSADSANGYPWF